MRETPPFPPAFARYLELNGWKSETVYTAGWNSYRLNDKRIIVRGQTIDVFVIDPNPRKPAAILYSLHGWPLLNEFTFMLQMHVMNLVPLKEFLRKARKECGGESITEAQLLQYFKIDELPLGY